MKRILLNPLIWLLAGIFLVEEYLWNLTARLMAHLGALRLIHTLENYISKLSPRWAIFVFILPSSILFPAKLIGLRLISNGHLFMGTLTFVIAKVSGVALVSRIFNLTKPTLMKVPGFARLYEQVMYYRNRIHAYLDGWLAYQIVKQRINGLVDRAKGFFSSAKRK